MSEKAEQLYDQARALPPEDREAFVREACRADPELRDELVSLLGEAEPAEEFFGLLGDAVVSASFSASRAPPASADLAPGQTIGHYRIVGRVGSGGMGIVYRAWDTRLGRDVALKFLPSYLKAGDEAEERLLIEARAGAGLEHPNVCAVHEIGETEDGRPFIAMAFCEGETLKDRLRRGPLAAEEATQVVVQLAHALAAAHARGIVHRDVKPGNVMLLADGTVKLLDFGLAKLADVTVTRPGETPGTMAYMSPEHVRGDPLDARTDLWSLGVVLYEALTAARPFRGGNDRALRQAILHEDPEPITEGGSEIPEHFTRIVERLLRKEPEARYGSAEQLLADLSAGSPGIESSRLRARLLGLTRRRRVALVGGTALVILAGVALWSPGRGRETVPATPSIAVLPLVDLSPDGRDAALADGLTEELTAILARAGGLHVIASTSVFAFKGSELDARRIADSLGVSHVLEGSVRKTGDRLRVQVRLVDARDGSTRWSDTYDREMQDMFAVQDEIARAVARQFDLRWAGDTAVKLLRHQSPNIAAYELYLRGSDQSLNRTDSGVRQAVEYFKQAIAADSTYAAAYAGLARAYHSRSNRYGGASAQELRALAEQAALKAVELDDSLSEAHVMLGIFRWRAYDFASGETELKRAIDLDPARARPHEILALHYLVTGRPADALAEARRAVEIEPLSPSGHAELAHALLANGRYDEALAQLQRIATVRPPLIRVGWYAAQAYAMKQMWPEAIDAMRPYAELGQSKTLAGYGYLLARGGQRDEALRIRATLLDRWGRGRSDAFDVAAVYAGLDDFDQAFVWLGRAIDDGSILWGPFSIMQPLFHDVRSDPRFARVRVRLGLQNR